MVVAEEEAVAGRGKRLVFTYGTLKRGFSNHRLMKELIETGDASFVGAYRTAEKYPLVCGPYRVPFLLNMPGRGHRVWGEVYEVSERGFLRMDELEGITRGHYQRLTIRVNVESESDDVESPSNMSSSTSTMEVSVYFGHDSYAEELWRKSGERGYVRYSDKEAMGYVKRKDRPQHLSFLDHISLFLSE